mmetsp:Transcript_77135/g.165291  ORF Transcript_77135/g.165291 Transcript_77135/m.165291 type:complete len:207 (+) Transcript_77135:1447-2067(+)
MILVPEDFCLFLAQLQDLADNGCVILALLPRLREFAGLCHACLVHFLAERPVVRVLHDGKVARVVECEDPGSLLWCSICVTLLLRCLCSQLERGVGETLHLRRLRQLQRIGLGPIEQIVGKVGAQLLELLLDLAETFLLRPFQGDTAESRVAELDLNNSLLTSAECLLLTVVDVIPSLVQRRTLSHTQSKLDDLRLDLFDGFPPSV